VNGDRSMEVAMLPVIGYSYYYRQGKYRPKCLDGGLNFSMIERGRFGPTDEGQP